MRRWQLTVTLDPESALPLFVQISRAIAGEILSLRLRPGDALPGSRTLARSLGVHRNTVLATYDALIAEGWLRTEAADGTFVADQPPTRRRGQVPVPPERVACQPGYRLAPPMPFERPPEYPSGMLVLAKGAPDPRLLPTTELARAYRRVLLRDGRKLLVYGDPTGHRRLREALASMLSAARGISAEPENIMVTRGSQMALDLAARALLAPGDTVAVESLGHPPAWSALRLAGARLIPIEVDRDGLRVDALEAALARQPIRAVYVTPHHQFPTTVVMSAIRRRALLELAEARGIAVIEDDYDHEFHYDGRPALPLASRDPSGVVLYVGTLSKILAPGLRVGFVVAPTRVIERMTSLRVATDLQGDLASECAVAELFQSGELGRHVRRMRGIYRARRDALVAALRAELGSVLEVEHPSGGMALWVRVAPGIDLEAWSGQARACGVAFRPGRIYDFHGACRSAARLGFTFHDEAELAEAARRMAEALRLVVAVA